MKKLIALLIFIQSSVLFAQTDSLFRQANQWYQQKDYEKAIATYESLLDEDTPKEVYFNLANAYYQQRNTANSIYYYEKAIKADPDFEAAKNNLRFAEKTRLDEFENQTIYTSSDIWHQTIGFFTTEKWAVFAITFLWIGAVLFLAFYFSKNRRRLFFTGMVLSIFVALLGILFAYQENKFQQNQRFAIVMNNETNVKAEGRSISKTIKTINEGTKVFVEEIEGKWAKIQLPDATEGWVLLDRIKEI
ncbi:MAG TPA: tetratricopeptide repeat protein [Flavobacterium sp.]|nr:tetratricopeptide repeat protein [Flavobacterium sp.]